MGQNTLSISCKHPHVHERGRRTKTRPGLECLCVLAGGTNDPADLWREEEGEEFRRKRWRGGEIQMKIKHTNTEVAGALIGRFQTPLQDSTCSSSKICCC